MPIDDGEVSVVLRQSAKRGGELMATFNMEYPDLSTAIHAIARDWAEGRVESMSVAGRSITEPEMAELFQRSV